MYHILHGTYCILSGSTIWKWWGLSSGELIPWGLNTTWPMPNSGGALFTALQWLSHLQGHESGKRMRIISSYTQGPRRYLLLKARDPENDWRLGWEERQNLEFQDGKVGNVGLGSHLLMWRKGSTGSKPKKLPSALLTSYVLPSQLSSSFPTTPGSRFQSQNTRSNDFGKWYSRSTSRIVITKRWSNVKPQSKNTLSFCNEKGQWYRSGGCGKIHLMC